MAPLNAIVHCCCIFSILHFKKPLDSAVLFYVCVCARALHLLAWAITLGHKNRDRGFEWVTPVNFPPLCLRSLLRPRLRTDLHWKQGARLNTDETILRLALWNSPQERVCVCVCVHIVDMCVCVSISNSLPLPLLFFPSLRTLFSFVFFRALQYMRVSGRLLFSLRLCVWAVF